MKIEGFLEQKKSLILKKWFEWVVQTYPADTSKFLKSQKDPFANPLGGTFTRGLSAIFDELLKTDTPETLRPSLDPMIRIRAIQDFTPSQAVSFIFALKKIIRDTLEKENRDDRFFDELFLLDRRIDKIGLLAFNIYVECREKIYQLQANEMRNSTFSAFQRAGLVRPIPEENLGR